MYAWYSSTSETHPEAMPVLEVVLEFLLTGCGSTCGSWSCGLLRAFDSLKRDEQFYLQCIQLYIYIYMYIYTYIYIYLSTFDWIALHGNSLAFCLLPLICFACWPLRGLVVTCISKRYGQVAFCPPSAYAPEVGEACSTPLRFPEGSLCIDKEDIFGTCKTTTERDLCRTT